jgi:hypothetical protein
MAGRQAISAAIGEEKLQGFTHGAKSDLVPGHLVFAEQARFERFVARIELGRGHRGAVEQMHLADAHDVEQGEQGPELDLCASLFDGLAHRAFGRRLTELQKARRQRPQAVARLDGALAQQHLVAPHRHRADDVVRVLVVHRAARRADRTLAVVVGWNAVGHRAAAGAAEANGLSRRQEHRGSLAVARWRV